MVSEETWGPAELHFMYSRYISDKIDLTRVHVCECRLLSQLKVLWDTRKKGKTEK